MHEQWRKEIERRMTGEAGAAVTIEAMLAYHNDRLPAAHPGKITRSDTEMLRVIAHDEYNDADTEDGARLVALAAKLERILPPGVTAV